MMRKMVWYGLAVAGVIAAAIPSHVAYSQSQQEPTAEERARALAAFGRHLPPLYPLEEAFLDWPLAPADKVYAAIDGKRIKQYVSELAAISRRYRDQGHQYWGRITGTSADVETQQWVLDKFKQAGITDVRT